MHKSSTPLVVIVRCMRVGRRFTDRDSASRCEGPEPVRRGAASKVDMVMSGRWVVIEVYIGMSRPYADSAIMTAGREHERIGGCVIPGNAC